MFEKAINKSTLPELIKFVSMLFLTFEIAMRKKLCQLFLDSEVCFFHIWKNDEQKNCIKNFKIRKCAFS